MKTYQYSINQIVIKFYLSFMVMNFVFFYSLYKVVIQGLDINWLYFCFIVCVPIIFFKEFVTLDHPTKVIIDEDGLTFVFLRFSHFYQWDEIEKIMIKQYGKLSDTVMIFINHPRVLRGKYWIDKKNMIHSDELIKDLEKINNKVLFDETI